MAPRRAPYPLVIQSAPWKVGREKVIGILLGPVKKEGKRRKIPVLDTLVSKADLEQPPFQSMKKADSRDAISGATVRWM